MKKKQKGKSGTATAYLSRNQALKKLSLSLPDFRRLCILKGIYPREPNNKKKALKGSTANKTLYWVKDIQFLAHEPLLKRFRQFKAFNKKIRKALGKGERNLAERLKNNRPKYTLDHLIRERYPTFIDALRDLDDALCMLALFAQVPSNRRVFQKTIATCQTLYAEFLQYCILTRAIRKVFLSIKGIYYQVEIRGQLVTWITPYPLSQKIPADVDIQVMSTFLEFYETLLGFVNFKLFTDENLKYPPVVNVQKLGDNAGLSSIGLESLSQSAGKSLITSAQASAPKPAKQSLTKEEQKQIKDSESRVATLKSKFSFLDSKSSESTEPAQLYTDPLDQLDEFPENKALIENNNDDVKLKELTEQNQQLKVFQKLFSKCVFFLSRETPRDSLEFLIRSFGGKLGWEGGHSSPIEEDDDSITHHIADRPSQKHQFLGRVYIQPQWVYDSINFQRLMPTEKYALGAKLPPHFSPFVSEQEGDYVPKELAELRGDLPTEISREDGKGEEEDEEENENQENGEDEEEDEENVQNGNEDDEEGDENEGEEDDDDETNEEDEEEEEEIDSDDEEAIYQKELQAEAAGIPFSDFMSKKDKTSEPKPNRMKTSELKQKEEEKEQKKLATIMMSKRNKRLYQKVVSAQNKKKHYVERMEKKRKRIDESKTEQKPKKNRVK